MFQVGCKAVSTSTTITPVHNHMNLLCPSFHPDHCSSLPWTRFSLRHSSFIHTYPSTTPLPLPPPPTPPITYQRLPHPSVCPNSTQHFFHLFPKYPLHPSTTPPATPTAHTTSTNPPSPILLHTHNSPNDTFRSMILCFLGRNLATSGYFCTSSYLEMAFCSIFYDCGIFQNDFSTFF